MHLRRVQGFYFALSQYSRIQAFTTAFLPSMQLYRPHCKTAHRALQGFSTLFTPFHRRRYQTDTSGYNTACSTLERITAPGCTPAHTKYKRYARMLYRSAQPPYYNNVYIRVRPFYGSMPDGATHRRPCQPGGVSILPTPGGLQSGTGQQSRHTGSVWHPPPGGAVQQLGRSGRRGTIGGYRRISFRAFAR